LSKVVSVVFGGSKSPREKRIQAREDRPTFDYASCVGHDLLVYTIVLVYSVMAPIISLFGLGYFVLQYLVQRYQLVYVYSPKWTGGGLLFSSVLYHHMLGGLLLFQLTMLGVLSVGEFGGVGALAILPLVTLGFWVLVYRRWNEISYYGAVDGVN